MQVKHSKYKNTGILFELLVRQITTDTLDGKDSPAKDILKKYFVKTELGREYKLYETLLKRTSLTESKANIVISTLTDSSKTLNRGIIKRQKYNLISEIQKHYDLNEFFNHKLPNYKVYAAFYTLVETYNTTIGANPENIINNKITILEALTQKEIINEENENIKQFLQESKDIRILTYKILIDKFNEKYDSFSKQQKLILKEYINNINDSDKLKDIVNKHFNYIKIALSGHSDKIEDKVTKIKLNEAIKLVQVIKKNEHPKEEHLLNLFLTVFALNPYPQYNMKTVPRQRKIEGQQKRVVSSYNDRWSLK
jgi:hypothetical protein